MRYSSPLPRAALAGAFLLGCSDQPGGTDPNPDAGPSFAAEISRFETPLIIGFAQESPPIATLVGVSPEHFPALCAGADPEAVADAMIVVHPSKQGGTSAKVLIKGHHVSALVWPVDVGAGGDVCDLALQPFVGSVNVTINDNEGEFFETAPGANAFFVKFVGTVTDQGTGQRYHLQGADQIVVLPDGTFKFFPLTFLRLTPIGH